MHHVVIYACIIMTAILFMIEICDRIKLRRYRKKLNEQARKIRETSRDVFASFTDEEARKYFK